MKQDAIGKLKKIIQDQEKEINRLNNIEVRLNTVLGSIAGIHWWKDVNGVYRGCNQAMADALGLESKDDIIGKTDYELPWSNQADLLVENDKMVMETGATQAGKEEPVTTNDGALHVFMVAKAVLHDFNGEVIGTIGNSIDITQQKQLAKSVEIEKQKAVAANQSKTEFLYNMRHDIRTPFSGILSLAKYLADNEEDLKKKEQLSEIAHASDTLLLYLNEILEFIQIESGEVPILMENFNLKNLVDHTVTALKPSVNLKNVSLSYNYDLDCEWVISDRFRIQRVLLNLLSNAVKFTESGSIDVNVTLEDSSGGDVLVCSVKDTGIGISEENHSKIFDKFTKLKTSYSSTNPGMGLGLHAVQSLVHELNGEISLTSVLGKGSTFTYKIPVEISQPDIDTIQEGEKPQLVLGDENKSPAITSKHDAQVTSNELDALYRVLLIEDSRISQLAAASLLDSCGYLVDTVVTGADAISCFKENQYDLVLLDIGLPDYDGYEVAKIFREIEAKKLQVEIPIIVVSAHVDEDQRNKHSHIIDEFIVKPLTVERLQEIRLKSLNKAMSRDRSDKLLFIDWNMAVEFNHSIDSAKSNLVMFQQQCAEYIKKINKHIDNPQKLSKILGQLETNAKYCGAVRIFELVEQSHSLMDASNKELLDTTAKDLVGELERFSRMQV